MAKKKISQLTSLTNISDTTILPVVDSGTSYRTTMANVKSYIGAASNSYVANAIANVTWANLSGAPNLSNYATTANLDNLSNTVANITWANLSGKPTIPTSIVDLGITDGTNGQVLTTNGNGNFTFTTVSTGSGSSYTDSNVASYLPTFTGNLTAGNANLGNLVTANYVSVSGNVVVGGGSGGNITGANNISGNSLGISNITANGNVTLGSISNVHITGGTSGYVLSTDGSGTLSWVAQSGGSGGATNEITNTSNGSTYSVSVANTGVITMNTARGGIEFGAMPEVGGPEHLHIMRPNGQNSSTDLFFGDDYNYVKLPGLHGSNPNTQQGVEIGSSLNEGTVHKWKFDTDGSLVFPDGSTQTTAYLTAQQYGYFTELVHTGDNNRVDMEAVAMDSDGNSYISYSYYDDSESKRYGGIIKFNSLGVQQWSKNIISGNIDAEYVQIVSLEYVVVSSTPTLLALGRYSTNTNDVGFTYFIDPADGSIIPTTNIEFTSGNGMSIKDGVFSVDPSGGMINAVVVGEIYEETLQKTLTPLAPSTTDKLYVSWTEFNASEVQSGSQLNYTVGGYYNVTMNGAFATASPDGTGSGLGIQVSAVEGGTYNIIRVNGWSGVINGWTSPQSIRVLGSNLGGVDGVNDFVFDFDPVVFADSSNNINAAVSNKTGTPVSDVFCSGSGGKDWSTEIGNLLSFEYQLNNQAFISRVGGTSWSKNIGFTDYDRLHSVVVDTSSGDNYAVGYMWNGNNRGSLVIKHDIAGNQEWAVYVDPANNTGGHVTSVDLLADGNIITVDENGTVTKIDSSDGSIIWQVTIDSGPSWNNEFRGTATPDGGYILTSDEDNDYTLYVARISGNDGSVEWTKRITRTFGGNTGEIGPQNDYDAQYIDCNSTHVTIAANSYLNGASPEYVGIVINFPIDGENTDGIYGQYVISSVTLDWTTESTTSVAATVNSTTSNVNDSSVTPTSSSSNLIVGKTNIGGGAEVAPPTSIVNGNSYANISTADGNLVIGVNNDSMTWTFSNSNRAIYGKADENITIAAVDASDDYYGVRQIVVDGVGDTHARTRLERDEFRIDLDIEGVDTSWTFNPTNFQVPSYKESSIYSYGGNLNLYAMNDGNNGVARLQSVSFMNGPNVYSQFEATPTGANVKVYNGGSNGGTEYDWEFDADGNLTLPKGSVMNDTSEIVTVTLDQFTAGGYSGTQVFTKVSDTQYELSPTGPYMELVSGIWRLKVGPSTYYDSTDLITWGTVAGGSPTPVGTLGILETINLTAGVDIAQVGSTKTIATDSNEGTGAGTPGVVDVPFDGTLYNAYPAGSTITFANGDVRTITSIIQGSVGMYQDISYSGSATTSSPEFPIILKTANYAAAIPAPEWTFNNTGTLTLPKGTILSETANSTAITPPGALAGQSLVVRLTGATGIISDHPSGFADGDTITLTVTPDYNYNTVTGTVDYTFTGCTSVQLGRALTGTLTFTAESAKPISWTIPVSSTMTTFTITLSNASGFSIVGIAPLTLTKTGSSEDHHIHLIAGDPSITDIYLGDDDQYVKIEKNGGNVIIGTDTNSRQWTFDTNGNLTFPDATVQTTALVQGEQIFTVDTGATDYAPTAVDFNLLFVTPAIGYSAVTPTSVTLPNGVPGQRLVIFNGSSLATLTVNPGPLGRDISGGVVAEFIYSSLDGWMPLYGTNSPT